MSTCKHENGHRWSDKGGAWYCKDGCGHHLNFNPHHAGEVKEEDWKYRVLSIGRQTPLPEKPYTGLLGMTPEAESLKSRDKLRD